MIRVPDELDALEEQIHVLRQAVVILQDSLRDLRELSDVVRGLEYRVDALEEKP